MTIALQLTLGLAAGVVMVVWSHSIVRTYRRLRVIPKVQAGLHLLFVNGFLALLAYSIARLIRLA